MAKKMSAQRNDGSCCEGSIVSISLIDLSHHRKREKNQYSYLVTSPMLSFIINMLTILLLEH